LQERPPNSPFVPHFVQVMSFVSITKSCDEDLIWQHRKPTSFDPITTEKLPFKQAASLSHAFF